MNYLLFTILSLSMHAMNAQPPQAQANLFEVWTCSETTTASVLIIARVMKGRKKGLIGVAGKIYPADFKLVSADRFWLFGDVTRGLHQYAFVIKPDGEAFYYIAAGENNTRPRLMFRCTDRVSAAGPASILPTNPDRFRFPPVRP